LDKYNDLGLYATFTMTAMSASIPARRGRARRPTKAAAQSPIPAAAPDVEALRRFRQIYATVRSHFRQVERTAGAGAAQLRALSLLRERPGLRVGDLAQAMDIHQSTASNLVKTLLQRQLIQTGRSAQDARVVQLRLTPAGEKVLLRVQGHYVGVLPRALQALPVAVLNRLNADLDLLLAAMQADTRSARTPLAAL